MLKKLKKLLLAFWESNQVDKEYRWRTTYGTNNDWYRKWTRDPSERYVPMWVTYLVIALVCVALAYFGFL